MAGAILNGEKIGQGRKEEGRIGTWGERQQQFHSIWPAAPSRPSNETNFPPPMSSPGNSQAHGTFGFGFLFVPQFMFFWNGQQTHGGKWQIVFSK
jgi:hypothetical protein